MNPLRNPLYLTIVIISVMLYCYFKDKEHWLFYMPVLLIAVAMDFEPKDKKDNKKGGSTFDAIDILPDGYGGGNGGDD